MAFHRAVRIYRGDELVSGSYIGNDAIPYKLTCEEHGDITDIYEEIQDGTQRYSVCRYCFERSPDCPRTRFMEVLFEPQEEVQPGFGK